MSKPSESVKNCYPTAMCSLMPKERYSTYREYLVYVDGDEELSLGMGRSADDINNRMLRKLES
jgi:hypothetical protein